MRYFALVVLLCGVLGCSKSQDSQSWADKKAETTDNEMTRYVGSLQQDVQKAQRAADKANKANEETQKAMQNPEGGQ